MNAILTLDAPSPAGHYSQAIVHDNLVYISGQLPVEPRSGKKRSDRLKPKPNKP